MVNNKKQKKIWKNLKDELLTKINIFPLSMMLAQAAIESGWGLSRFAQKRKCFVWSMDMESKSRNKTKRQHEC